MAGPSRPVEERSYGGWFLLLSALMAAVTAWVVYDEAVTRRPWKDYQREFYARETERLDAAIAGAEEKLKAPAAQKELAGLARELARAREELSGAEYKEALNEFDRASRLRDDVRQDLIFLGSERDEAFYFWKRGLHRGDEAPPERERFMALSKKVAEKEAELEAREEMASAARALVDEFTATVSELGARREKITAGYDKLLVRKKKLMGKRPEIRQAVIPELNAVDRCVTCHLAIDMKGYDGENDEHPYRTHTELATLLGRHQSGRFGCTVCHHGQGPQVKGIGNKPFDHGRSDPYWERPLLEKPFTESTCRACHLDEWEIDLAPTLNRGKQAFSDLACYACHLTGGFEKGRRIGPSLVNLKTKVDSGWLIAWLEDPRGLRPRTKMPNAWPGAADEKSAAGNEAKQVRESEAMAVAAFLLGASTDNPLPLSGSTAKCDARRGKKLFIDRGCLGCHRPAALDLPPLESQALLKDFGPDLSYMGSKTTARWIASFLADPKAYFGETRMPNSQLNEDDRTDLAAFLAGLARERPFPAPGALDNPDLIERGRELISSFGCYGCHEIKGFEDSVKSGPELDGFGEKSPEFLAFGDTITDFRDQTWQNWTVAKLAAPRDFQTEKIELWMPDNNLVSSEVEALAVYLKSMVTEDVHPDFLACMNETMKAKEDGERLVKEFNCLGCHVRDGQGGDIRRVIRDPGLVPPDLTGEGSKVQPAWLYQFLKKPEVLRPWMTMTMPDFGLADSEADAFVRYFMALSEKGNLFVEVPKEMEPGLMEETVLAFNELKCLQCHQLTLGEGQVFSDLAPDMALTRYRLRPDWMEEFIIDPQWLMPGTKMPSFFPLEDDEDPESIMTPLPGWLGGDPLAQIRAVRDYLYLMESQDALAVESPERSQGD